jgi:hypothetical protein
VVDVYWRQQVRVEVNGREGFGAVGAGWYDLGSEVTWSVQSPVPTAAGMRVRAEPASGTLYADAPCRVDPAWITEARLEVRRNLPGIVSPASGWYAGSVVVRAENRNAGTMPVYRFQRWEGDIDDTRKARDAELTLSMDRPREVTAFFAFNENLPVTTQQIPLFPGWNLISPSVYPRVLPGTVEPGTAGEIASPVWGWDTARGCYRPLDMAVPGEGFWVLARRDGLTFAVEGYHPGNIVPPIRTGWQLIGISSATEIPLDPGEKSLWEWAADRQAYRRAASLVEGRAYWRWNN